MCHGRQDPVVPPQYAMLSRDALMQQGYAVQWQEYPMQHEVCAQELADIAAWLRQRLA
jgi:phospholipase/carboxylesterase